MAVVLLSPSAFAQSEGYAGAPCATSAQCGGLRCIDEVCRDPEAPEQQRVHTTNGFKGMFGDGHEYQTTILIADIAATLSVPLLALGAAAAGSSALGIVTLFPTTLTGPLIHVFNGRPIPAVISLFGWAAIPATAVGIAVLVEANGVFSNLTTAITTFVAISVAGAGLMTALDYYMARKVEPDRATKTPIDLTIAPSLVPVHGGALAGASGTW
jgi:hypothetical protein